MAATNKLDTVKETVDAALIESLGISGKKTLDPSDTLIGDLGADSLDMVEVCMMIEDELNVAIPDDLPDEVTTVQELTVAIEKLVSDSA